MSEDARNTRRCPHCNANLADSGSVLRGWPKGSGKAPVPGRYDAWGHFDPGARKLSVDEAAAPLDFCAGCGADLAIPAVAAAGAN